MYFLDTNIISEARKIPKGRANPGVKTWLESISQNEIFTNIVVLMELDRGILQKERKDAVQGKLLRHWFEVDILRSFSGRILTLDQHTATICARLHIPDAAPENDAWIASSAIQHNLTLVTRNVADFERTGVRLFNPFSE